MPGEQNSLLVMSSTRSYKREMIAMVFIAITLPNVTGVFCGSFKFRSNVLFITFTLIPDGVSMAASATVSTLLQVYPQFRTRSTCLEGFPSEKGYW
jgi:hypothetical protein